MEKTKGNWPDEVRLEMIEKSEFYQHPQIYQYGYYDGYQKASQQTAALQQRVKELEGEWVSVEERLPDIGVRVFIFTDSGYKDVGYILHKEFYREADARRYNDLGYNITHWRPLPPAPGE